MSKRATPLEKPEIMLDQNASAPLYRQLYERLRGSILSGQLEAGTRLMSCCCWKAISRAGWEMARGWHVCNQSRCFRGAETCTG